MEKIVEVIVEGLLKFYDNGVELHKKSSYGKFIIKNGKMYFIDTDGMKYTYTCGKDLIDSDELVCVLQDIEEILEVVDFNCDFKVTGTKNK